MSEDFIRRKYIQSTTNYATCLNYISVRITIQFALIPVQDNAHCARSYSRNSSLSPLPLFE